MNSLRLEDNAWVHPDTRIGQDSFLGHGSIVGKLPMISPMSAANRDVPDPVKLGDGVRIGALSIICAGAEVGDHVTIGDQVFIREGVCVGRESVIGRGCSLETGAQIGTRVRIQTNVYLAPRTIIEDETFLGPCVVTADDNYMGRTPDPKEKRAPLVKSRCRVGAGAVLLPGSVLGENCYVAAGAVVGGVFPPETVIRGVPARSVGSVQEFRWNG